MSPYMRQTVAPRLEADLAAEIVTLSVKWARENCRQLASRREADIANLLRTDASFWSGLRPLFDRLLEPPLGCAWVTAGLRLGSRDEVYAGAKPVGFYFFPVARQDVRFLDGATERGPRVAWQLADRIGELSCLSRKPPFEILLASDVCVNVLADGLPLTIFRTRASARVHYAGWGVELEEFAAVIDPVLGEVTEILEVAAASDRAALELRLREVDAILESALKDARVSETIRVRRASGVVSDQAEEELVRALVRGRVPGMALAKYFAVMTVVWPGWQRIRMLPHLGPMSGHSQPGGLVVCEDQNEELGLSEGEADYIASLSSVAMWPWLSLQLKSEEPADDLVPLLTVLDQLKAASNDYREATKQLRLGPLHLVDVQDEDAEIKAHKDLAYHALCSDPTPPSFSVIIPVRGREGCESALVECLASIERQSFFKERPECVEVLIIQDGPSQCVGAVDPLESPRVLTSLSRFPTHCRRGFCLVSNRGRATARNVGIFYASKDVLLFLDSTMVLDKDFFMEHLVRHGRIPSIALLGFKENLSSVAFESERAAIERGTRRPDFRRDWKCSHVLSDDEAWFEFQRHLYYPGEVVDYMKLSDSLNSLGGGRSVGWRDLPAFFQTNIASVQRHTVRSIGGFSSDLDARWGYEDSFLGACLVAKGVRLVPCPSSVAFKIEHPESAHKSIDVTTKRRYYQKLLATTRIQSLSESLLVKAINDLSSRALLKEVNLSVQ